jgi:hypothetical protein
VASKRLARSLGLPHQGSIRVWEIASHARVAIAGLQGDRGNLVGPLKNEGATRILIRW